MVLIPQSPGGSQRNAPCYSVDQLPPAQFDVLLDDTLDGEPVEYYRGRAQLAAATFHVLVFDAATYQPFWQGRQPQPVAVLGPDEQGRFRLDRAELSPGSDYLWLVTAQVDEAGRPSQLWSVPQYFKTLPQPQLLPEQLGADARPLQQLLVQKAQQERAAAAAASALRGLAPYYNFAAASDSFICTSLSENTPTPYPDHEASGAIPFVVLLKLGDLAARSLALSAASTEDRWRDLSDLVHGVAQLLLQHGSSSGVAALMESGDQLARVTSDLEGRPALSQLLISLDAVLASGTRDPLKTGVDSFPAYARATNRRIEALQEYSAQIQDTLGAQQWQPWDSYLRQIRGELILLSEDIESGRMNRAQLEQQLRTARQITPPLYTKEWRFVGSDGQLNAARIERLQANEAEQLRRLAEELYWYHLGEFSGMLIPQT